MIFLIFDIFFDDLFLGEGAFTFEAFRFLGVEGEHISWCMLSDLMTIGVLSIGLAKFLVDRRDMMLLAMALG